VFARDETASDKGSAIVFIDHAREGVMRRELGTLG
jgi:hypothetical protein